MDTGKKKKCKNGQKCWAENPPKKKAPTRELRKRAREVNRKYK